MGKPKLSDTSAVHAAEELDLEISAVSSEHETVHVMCPHLPLYGERAEVGEEGDESQNHLARLVGRIACAGKICAAVFEAIYGRTR